MTKIATALSALYVLWKQKASTQDIDRAFSVLIDAVAAEMLRRG